MNVHLHIERVETLIVSGGGQPCVSPSRNEKAASVAAFLGRTGREPVSRPVATGWRLCGDCGGTGMVICNLSGEVGDHYADVCRGCGGNGRVR